MAPRCWRQGAAALLVAVATVVPSDAVDDGACGFACYDLTGSLAGTPHQCTCTPEHCDKSACEQGGGIFIDNCDTDLKLKVVHLYGYSSAFPHTRTRTAFPSVM